MRNRIFSVFALIMTVVLLLSACNTLTFNSPENLVRPPKLSGDDGQLQAAFEAAVSEQGEYVLRYPSDGEYRSAFVRHDCNGDGNDEAFVFYSLKAEEMAVYMYMLSSDGGKWTATGSVPGDGNDVYSIEFCDLNDDGTDEVFVGWSSIDSKANKKLAVYCSDADATVLNYKVIAIESYTSMYATDLDSDGETEILLALINSTSDTYTTEAKLLKMTESSGSFQISPVGQVSLYSEITAINQITSGLSGDRKYVYIDETAGDLYLTEMLFWNDENSTLSSAILIDVLSVASCPTSRSLPLVSADIDSDGEIEIPVTTLMHDSSIIRNGTTENGLTVQNENVYVTSWKKFDDGKFTAVESYIENEDDGFVIEYDKEEMANWCVKFYPEDGISQFFLLRPSEDPEIESELILLFTIGKGEINPELSSSLLLTETDEYRYTYQITEAGEEQGITRRKILSFFSLKESDEL